MCSTIVAWVRGRPSPGWNDFALLVALEDKLAPLGEAILDFQPFEGGQVANTNVITKETNRIAHVIV